MTHQQLRKKTEGFTIIEVLIVLAIAGLILLIVFLAVPALQRNSRNTQLRNDASVILGYVSDYVASHNGGLPNCLGVNTATGDVSAYASDNNGTPLLTCSGTATELGKIRPSTDLSTARGNANSELTTNDLHIILDRKCFNDSDVVSNANTPSGPVIAKGAVAVRFKVETAGAPVTKCLES